MELVVLCPWPRFIRSFVDPFYLFRGVALFFFGPVVPPTPNVLSMGTTGPFIVSLNTNQTKSPSGGESEGPKTGVTNNAKNQYKVMPQIPTGQQSGLYPHSVELMTLRCISAIPFSRY